MLFDRLQGCLMRGTAHMVLSRCMLSCKGGVLQGCFRTASPQLIRQVHSAKVLGCRHEGFGCCAAGAQLCTLSPPFTPWQPQPPDTLRALPSWCGCSLTSVHVCWPECRPVCWQGACCPACWCRPGCGLAPREACWSPSSCSSRALWTSSTCTRCALGPTVLLAWCRDICPVVAGNHAQV